ncbi:MAG: hypothetical protein GXO91_06005 [FCB group bacterium]|nr:hypothetical protein [FCB group bacterium]
MRKLGILLILFLYFCAKPVGPSEINPIDSNGLEALFFGTDTTFEMITWNIEQFPKAHSITVNYAAQILYQLSPEVAALQEIGSGSYFNMLVDTLNGLDTANTWLGYRAAGASYNINLAYIIKRSALDTVTVPVSIFQDEWSAFPRAPYVLSLTYHGNAIVIIDNHFKCCGDGTLDYGNWGDEEYRRLRAVELLQDYISETYAAANVIVVGDMNDEITDAQSNNVFWDFIDDPENYKFADMSIAEDNTQRQWSYPSWPSHLDHILITNELFDEFDRPASEIRTIRIDDYIEGGWGTYNSKISDHRPVGLKLSFQ